MEAEGEPGSSISLPSSIRIGESAPIGKGVFATRSFGPGELIESAPVIVIPADEWLSVEKTVLFNYCYAYGESMNDIALALGFGSLYNHSYTPNARYVRRQDQKLIEFFALRPIAMGEEITINYNGDPGSLDPLWFTVLK